MSATRVYVGNLYHDTRERDLEKFFKGYGRLRDVFLKNGYGFVEFEDPRDADDAVYELNGRELLGERVTVEHARGPSRNRRGFGGGDRFYGRERRPAWLDKYGPPQRTEYRIIVGEYFQFYCIFFLL